MLTNYRYPGEFEAQDAVFINWVADQYAAEGYDSHQTFVDVIRNLVGHAKVYVNCGVEGTIADCPEKSDLSANGHVDEMARFADSNTILLAEVTDEEAARLDSIKI